MFLNLDNFITLRRENVRNVKKALVLLCSILPINFLHIEPAVASPTLKSYEAVLHSCNKAINDDPMFDDGYRLRGDVYKVLGLYERALEDYKKALELNSANSNAERSFYDVHREYELINQSIEFDSEQIELHPGKDNSLPHYRRGRKYLYLGQYEKAVSDFSESINWNLFESYNERHFFYAKQKKSRETKESLLEKQKKLYRARYRIFDDRSAAAFACRGHSFFELNKLEKAVSDYQKALAIDNRKRIVYFWRAEALYKLGKYAEAAEDLTKSIEVFPENTYDLLLYRAKAFYKDRRISKALTDCSEAIKLRPNDPIAYELRGDIYREKKPMSDPQKSIRDYEKALELDPTDVFAYAGIGRAEKMQGKIENALKAFTKAIDIGTMDSYVPSRAYTGRGDCFMSLADYRKALIDYEKAATTDEFEVVSNYQNAERLFNSGYAHLFLGNYESAIKSWIECFKFLLQSEELKSSLTAFLPGIVLLSIFWVATKMRDLFISSKLKKGSNLA